MGKIFGQESEVTPLSRQMQVVGGHASKIPAATVTNHGFHLKREYMGSMIVTKHSPVKPSYNFFQQEMVGSFPDYNPPISGLMYNITAFSDTDEIFLRSQNVDSSNHVSHVSNYINVIKANGVLRQCPGGQQGGNASGGASYNSGGTGSTNTGTGSSWVLSGGIGGGFSGGMGGAGGGDDDPFNNWQHNSGPTPPVLFDEEEFNSSDYFDDPILADMLRDLPIYDIVLSTPPIHPGVYRDHSYNSYPTDYSSDPPSTPAPLTPLTPMVNPPTPHSMQGLLTPHNLPKSQIPSQSMCIQPSDNSIQNILDIQKLLINGGKEKTDSNISNSTTLIPTLVPQPSSMPSYPNTLLHQTTIPRPVAAVEQQRRHNNDIDFLDSNTSVNERCRMIELFVPNNAPREKKDIGFRALMHCHKIYLDYLAATKDVSCNELQVAVQNIAQLCEMEIGNTGQPRLRFMLPRTCVPLNEWMYSDHSVDKRQIVLQQLINTLTILFKAQNDLCFWGSSKIWVDVNLRVYLYIDFINALAVQKDYAENRIQSNPRVEDCKVLLQLYETMLKPFLHRDLTWISPHLNTVFQTFETLFMNPANCVSNMAYVARLFGERRICKLVIQQCIPMAFEYTVYCAEHETVAAAVGVLARVLPYIANLWGVVRSHDNSTVGVTDMATKEGEGMYLIFPVPEDYNLFPGALYIESKQCF